MEASNYVSAVLWVVPMKSRAFPNIKSSSPLKSQILLSMHVTAHTMFSSTHPSYFLTNLRLLSYDFHPMLR
jgi:hypothetical protein